LTSKDARSHPTPDSSLRRGVVQFPRRIPKATGARRRNRRRKFILVGMVLPLLLFSALAIVGSYVLSPEQLRLRATALLQERLQVEFHLDPVKYSFPSTVIFEGIKISAPAGSRFTQLVDVPLIRLDFAVLPLLLGRTVLKKVEIDGARVYLERDDLGDLTLLKVLREATIPASGPMPEPQPEVISTPALLNPPEVIITNLSVETCPETVFKSTSALDVPSVRLEFSKEDPRSYQVSGLAFDPAVEAIHLRGSGKISTGDFQLELTVDRLKLDEQLRERLPQTLAVVWDRYLPTGTATFRHQLILEDSQLLRNAITLELMEGSIQLPQPKVEIRGIRGKVDLTPERLRIVEPLTGIAWGGKASLEGEIDVVGLLPGAGDLRLRIEGVRFEPEVRAALPEKFQAVWDLFSPSGKFDAFFRVQGEEFPPQIQDIRLQLHEVDLVYAGYPYPLRNAEGYLRYQKERVEIRVEGGSKKNPSRVEGFFDTVAKGPMQIRIESDNLPLDDRARTALGTRFTPIWDQYRPSGKADLRIDLRRTDQGAPLAVEVLIEGRGAAISHRDFPYQVEGITGRVHIDNERVTFENLAGSHDGVPVAIENGEVRFAPSEAKRIEVPIRSHALRIDEDLLNILSDPVASKLRSLGLLEATGSLEALVEMRKEPETDFEVFVRADIKEPMLLSYEKLPYPLLFSSGSCLYSSSEGRIRLDRLKTAEDSTPGFEVNAEFGPDDTPRPAATGLPEERTLFSAEILITPGPEGRGLDLADPLLIDSLPADPRNFLKGMRLTGDVSAQIEIEYLFGEKLGSEKPYQHVEYDVEATLHNGGFDISLSTRNLNAHLTMHGKQGSDLPHSFSGELRGVEFRFGRFHLTTAEEAPLTFCYGKRHPLIEQAKLIRTYDNNEIPGSPSYLPSDRLVARCAESNVGKLFQASLGPSSLYGGRVDGFFFADLADSGVFAGEATVSGVDIRKGSADIFGVTGSAGIAQGEIFIGGETHNPKSLSGGGGFRVRNGNFTKIPMIAAIILNPLKGFNHHNNRIKEVDCNFRVEGQSFTVPDWEDLVLMSPSLRILGKGRMGFDTKLNFILEPQTLGGFPLLSELVNRLTRFRLRGTLDSPETLPVNENNNREEEPGRRGQLRR